MFVMTAKVSKTKIAAIITAVIALVVIIVIAVSAGGTAPSQSPTADTNDARVKFLAEYGWDVNAEPVQSQSVHIPDTAENEVFARYNELQMSQGYDLTQYAAKKAQRYVYEILNYPDTEADCPVYATMFVLDGNVIAGDVTNTAPSGKMHGFALPSELGQPIHREAEATTNYIESSVETTCAAE